jgi:hypothetical protein
MSEVHFGSQLTGPIVDQDERLAALARRVADLEDEMVTLRKQLAKAEENVSPGFVRGNTWRSPVVI